jgi:hypothetical protein
LNVRVDRMMVVLGMELKRYVRRESIRSPAVSTL